MPRGGIDYPRSFPELLAWFPDEPACLAYLERVRWGDGFVCRFCGVQGDWWPVRRGHRKCAACRRETSVTAGTIMHASRLPLTSWLAAIWYVVNQKQGVSALGLQRVLGFGSYQTAWAWLHKLRRAMVRANRDRLSGVVEIDETIIGGLRHGEGKGRGMANKTLVAIAVDTRDGRPGRVRMAQIPNATMDVLTDFVLDNVQIGSEVRTDGWKGYNAVGRHRFQHVLTSLKASDDHAHVVLPAVHRVASLLKRWLLGTHQGAVSHEHLGYYLDEFTFRFNRRAARHRGLLFYRLIEGALATAPHPYNSLTASHRADEDIVPA
jgi:transposase-like protein